MTQDTPYPCVFGHESAGMVEAVGNGVSTIAIGDHVIMSFPWCGNCANCRRDMHSHCQQSFAEALMPAGTCVLLGSARSGTEVTFMQGKMFGSRAAAISCWSDLSTKALEAVPS